MKYLMLSTAMFFAINVPAQVRPPGSVSEPQHIVIDSKDNVFVTLKYGMLKIAPDGTVTDLSKQGPVIRGMDRNWQDLIIDSKDNLYAHDGNVIYKITVSVDNKAALSKFAGQVYSYKLEDGPLATAGFNAIGLMTIDRNDNIYLTDSADKIKDTIGTNFVTDSFNLTDAAKKIDRKNRKAFRMSRKMDTARSGASSIPLLRRNRWKSYAVKPAKMARPATA